VKRTHAAWLAGTLTLMAVACATFGALSVLLVGWHPFVASSKAATPLPSAPIPQGVRKGAAPVSEPIPKLPSGAGLSAAEFANLATRLDDYRPLKEKVVVNEAEQRVLHALLSDPEKLQAAAAILGGEAEEVHTPKTRIKRMDAVDFLAEAIAWHDNSSRSLALELARAVVLDENHHRVSSTWLKQDFVGDKLELIEVLRTEDPRSLKVIAVQANEIGSRNRAVLRHAGVL